MPRDLAALPRLVVAVDPDSRSSALAWAVRRDAGECPHCGGRGGFEQAGSAFAGCRACSGTGDLGGYVFVGCEGGGSRAVTYQTITGARAWLSGVRLSYDVPASAVDVVIETQAPTGPQSADCEPLRRVRYHWQAACEVDGYDCVFVDASTWQPAFVRGEPKERGAGAMKRMYQRKAKALTLLAVNEDRCAAIGMLCWYVHDVINATLVFDRG